MEKRQRMSLREKREHWLGRLEEQRLSGLSMAAWCRREGVPYWKFLYWRRRLNGASAGSSESVAFHEIVVADQVPGSCSALEVCLPSGIVVRVSGSVDRQNLRLVLEEAARC